MLCYRSFAVSAGAKSCGFNIAFVPRLCRRQLRHRLPAQSSRPGSVGTNSGSCVKIGTNKERLYSIASATG